MNWPTISGDSVLNKFRPTPALRSNKKPPLETNFPPRPNPMAKSV